MDLATWVLRRRWLVRAPVPLFRAGLGGLAAGHLLLLEHRGRTTGARRSVVLEVIGGSGPEITYVASGLGLRSQWLLNVLAEPRVLVTVGWRGPRRAAAHVVTGAVGAAVLDEYTARHRRAWHELEPVLRRWAEPLARDLGAQDWRQVVPVVELRLMGAARRAR